MGLIESLLVAVGLGADAFSVALGVWFGGVTPRQTFRLSYHFGLFQFLMPLLGWVLGARVAGIASRCDHWIAFAILFAIGAKMMHGSFQPHEARSTRDLTRGWSLVGLSVATSLDALGVGVGLGIAGARCLQSAGIIGVVACVMTLLGLWLGDRLSAVLGKRLETVGAVLILLMSLKMLTI